MDQYYFYAIQNPQGCLYKGISTNVEKRVHEHNTVTGKWTSSRGPWTLVYSEQCANKSEALQKEKFYKSGQGRQLLKEKIG